MLNNVFTIKMENVLKLFSINLYECKNYQKQRTKVAKFHNKVKQQRLDNLHSFYKHDQKPRLYRCRNTKS